MKPSRCLVHGYLIDPLLLSFLEQPMSNTSWATSAPLPKVSHLRYSRVSDFTTAQRLHGCSKLDCEKVWYACMWPICRQPSVASGRLTNTRYSRSPGNLRFSTSASLSSKEADGCLVTYRHEICIQQQASACPTLQIYQPPVHQSSASVSSHNVLSCASPITRTAT
jgi:hypothetical protein